MWRTRRRCADCADCVEETSVAIVDGEEVDFKIMQCAQDGTIMPEDAVACPLFVEKEVDA